jgi:hypothetical protein
VVLTSDHSFSGQLSLRDQRLSDFLNNRQNTFIVLRQVRVARLADPSKILEQDSHAALSKSTLLIAFAWFVNYICRAAGLLVIRSTHL